jgi:putative lipoic acid-binding regulatory protein
MNLVYIQADSLNIKSLTLLPLIHVPLQVNKYPCQRVFNAIGTGGDDFRAKMMQAVESVVGTIHVECVSERPSSGGKYVSVRIGPVWVENADQVGACRCFEVVWCVDTESVLCCQTVR